VRRVHRIRYRRASSVHQPSDLQTHFPLRPHGRLGTPVNTKPVFFGDVARQSDWIAPDGSRDRMVHIDDPAKLYVKLGLAGESLEYRIEF